MFTEKEFDLLTHALTVLCATENDKFGEANDLHSKLIFNKEKFVIFDAGLGLLD